MVMYLSLIHILLGEDEDESQEGSFNNASVWRRMSVIAAGPVFNFILAFLVAVVVISVCLLYTSYVAEMIMDRISASRTYLGKGYTDQAPYEYYMKGKDHL